MHKREKSEKPTKEICAFQKNVHFERQSKGEGTKWILGKISNNITAIRISGMAREGKDGGDQGYWRLECNGTW